MGLINLANGHFELPGRLVITPSATPPDFEAAFGKGSFQFRWENSGFEEHFLASPIIIAEEQYFLTFFFKYRKLVSMHLHVEPLPRTNLNQDEEVFHDYYREWLDREIGTKREYPWGFCDLRFDPKTQEGYIELSYLD